MACFGLVEMKSTISRLFVDLKWRHFSFSLVYSAPCEGAELSHEVNKCSRWAKTRAVTAGSMEIVEEDTTSKMRSTKKRW